MRSKRAEKHTIVLVKILQGSSFFRVINTAYYEKGVTSMYIVKKILVKSAISLCVGVASTIGMRLGGAIWDRCHGIKTDRNAEEILI